jgi:hypothetical protein
MKNTIIFVLGCISILVSCTEMTEPKLEPKQQQKPYMTLQIGDIRQYYSSGDRIYFDKEIVDTVRRSDGLKVYKAKYTFYTLFYAYIGYSYEFIRDGYYFLTSLDTITEPNVNIINPFNEVKTAKIYPKDGEIFLANEGAPDNEKEYRKIKLLETFSTPIKTYQDVCECEIIFADGSRKMLVYYSSEYGHFSTKYFGFNNNSYVFLVYLKLSNKEFGDYINFFEKNVIEGIPEKYKKYNILF